MKVFQTSILFVVVAVALCAAAPRPEDAAANSVEPAVAAAPEDDSTGTKQNPILDGFNNFLQSIPQIPGQIQNAFSNIGNTNSNTDAAAAPTPTGPNVLESIQQALSPEGIGNFFNGIFNPQPTKAAATADATTEAAVVAAVPTAAAETTPKSE